MLYLSKYLRINQFGNVYLLIAVSRLPGSVPFPCRSVDDGAANAAGYPHERRRRHPCFRRLGRMAPTIFCQSNDAPGVRRYAKVSVWTMATSHPDSGSHHESPSQLRSAWLHASRTCRGSSGLGHHLQSRRGQHEGQQEKEENDQHGNKGHYQQEHVGERSLGVEGDIVDPSESVSDW